jgi:23S rRNA pseudouridine2605 synthase
MERKKSGSERKKSDKKTDSSYSKPKKKSYSDDKKKSYSSDEKKKSYSSDDRKKSYSPDDRKKSYSSDDRKKSYSSDDRKKSYSSDDRKKSYSPDDRKKTYSSDDNKKSYSPDDRKKSYSPDDRKKSYSSDDKKKSYSSDDKKKSYSSDDRKKSYSPDDRKKSYSPDDRKKSYSPDDRKKSYSSDDRKKSYSSDDRKKSYSSDDNKKSYSPDDRKKSYSSDDKKKDSSENTAWENSKNERHVAPERKSVRILTYDAGDSIRLNRYIANAGVCSRREADSLISVGAITVNGKVVTELGTKVLPTDVVLYEGQRLSTEKKVYILLNKPKDYITTADDPQGRKNVMMLIANACKERVVPVGRLDRNTTGVLLLTNDGEMITKLTHPKHGVRKLYHVQLDKNVTKADMTAILKGVRIDDGVVAADNISYVDNADSKKEVGIEIHSGQNRVVRRIFESLGYDVVKLDRVSFAGLTKKDVPRGKWRLLSEKEVNFLRMI